MNNRAGSRRSACGSRFASFLTLAVAAVVNWPHLASALILGPEYRIDPALIGTFEALSSPYQPPCRDADGAVWHAAYRCPTRNDSGCEAPGSFANASGECNCRDGGDIVLGLFDDEGSAIGDPMVVNSTPAERYPYPEVWCTPDASKLLVVWDPDWKSCRHFAVADASGAPIVAEAALDSRDAYCSIGDLRIVGGDDGSFGVAWYDSSATYGLRTVHWRRIDGNTGKAGDVVEVGVPTSSSRAPDVGMPAIDARGNAVVPWVDNPDLSNRYQGVYAAVLNANDRVMGIEGRLNEFLYTRTWHAVARVNTTGRITVGWEGSDVGGWIARDVAISEAVSVSTTSTTSTTLPPPAVGPFRAPQRMERLDGSRSGLTLAVGPGGNLAAAWERGVVAVADGFGQPWALHDVFPDGATARIIAESQGSWLLGWLAGSWLGLVRSEDGGQTWASAIDSAESLVLFDWYYQPYLNECEWCDVQIGPFDLAADGDTVLAAYLLHVTDRISVNGYDENIDREQAIYVVRSDSGGAKFAVPVQVADVFGRGRRTVQDVEIEHTDGDGWLVVWDHAGALSGSWSDDDGRTWSNPGLLGGGLSQEHFVEWVRNFDVACNGAHCLVAFSGWGPDPAKGGVFVSRSTDGGASWSEATPLGGPRHRLSPRDRSPSLAHLAVDGADVWVAAWISYNDVEGKGLDADVVYATSEDGGLTWSRPAILDADAVGDETVEYNPVLAAGAGDVGALWTATEISVEDDGYAGSYVYFGATGAGCRDGYLNEAEECDDANAVDGDGCDSNCTTTRCGNGIVAGAEECDDGNTIYSDRCAEGCRRAACGDGYVRDGEEQCDDGNLVDGDGCDSNCTETHCGNGVVTVGEDCDDAGDQDDDACTSECKFAVCGDGHRYRGVEECDDGNDRDDDACTTACTSARCGDGIVWDGVEDCDDGNRRDGDGCNGVCRIEGQCGDVDGDGRITVSDALRVLLYAARDFAGCSMRMCDVDRSNSVTVTDALIVLQAATGLTAIDGCGPAMELVFRLEDAVVLGALQIEFDFSGAALDIATRDAVPSCQTEMPDVFFMAGGIERRALNAAVVSATGFEGPRDLFACVTTGPSPPQIDGLEPVVIDASTPDLRAVDPPPTVSMYLR